MEDIAKAFGVPQAEVVTRMQAVKGGRRGAGIMEDIAKAFGVPQTEVVTRMQAVKTGSGILEDMGRAFGLPQAAQMEVRALQPSQALGMFKGGRKPSAYAMFVKEFAAKNPGPNLMKRAGEAWRSQK
jgi:hypothetical protein